MEIKRVQALWRPHRIVCDLTSCFRLSRTCWVMTWARALGFQLGGRENLGFSWVFEFEDPSSGKKSGAKSLKEPRVLRG